MSDKGRALAPFHSEEVRWKIITMCDIPKTKPKPQAVVPARVLLVGAEDAARLLAFSKRELHRMVSAGELPQPLRLGRRLVRWRVADLEAWVAKLNGERELGANRDSR